MGQPIKTLGHRYLLRIQTFTRIICIEKLYALSPNPAFRKADIYLQAVNINSNHYEIYYYY